MLVIKKRVMQRGSYAVKDLLTIISDKKYPIENRWSSIYFVSQIMGQKSVSYLKKLTRSKHLMIRLAALKNLVNLSVQDKETYSRLLNDKAMIVRFEVLDSIIKLNMKSMAPYVWKMLYDEKNYSKVTGGTNKRSKIIKKIIRTIGDLEFKKAKIPLLKMAINNKFTDIFNDIDYSLTKITSKASKGSSIQAKRLYWKIQSI